MPPRRNSRGQFVSGGSGVEGIPAAKKAFRDAEKAATSQFVVDCTAAADEIRDEAQSTNLFTDRKRKLRQAIRTKLEENRGGRVRVKVGPDPRKAPHGHLVELGHNLVTSKAKGRRKIGYVDERPYMRTAFENRKESAQKCIEAGLKEALK